MKHSTTFLKAHEKLHNTLQKVRNIPGCDAIQHIAKSTKHSGPRRPIDLCLQLGILRRKVLLVTSKQTDCDEDRTHIGPAKIRKIPIGQMQALRNIFRRALTRLHDFALHPHSVYIDCGVARQSI